MPTCHPAESRHLVDLGKSPCSARCLPREPDRNDTFSTANRSDSGTRERRSSLMRDPDLLRYQQAAVCPTPSGHGTGVFAAIARRRTSALVSKGSHAGRVPGRDALPKACTTRGCWDRLCRRRIGAAGRASFRLCRYILLGFHDCLYAGNSASTAVFSARAASKMRSDRLPRPPVSCGLMPRFSEQVKTVSSS